eukprot:125148_1
MILVLSTFAIFSIMAFAVIFETDFSQMSIQSLIEMCHSNPCQHIHFVKLYTNLQNNHHQLYLTCTPKSTEKPLYSSSSQILTIIIFGMSSDIAAESISDTMHLVYFIFRKYSELS